MKTIHALVLGAASLATLAVTTGVAKADWYYDRWHHRHWREHRVYAAPPPAYYAPPPPPVVYAPPPAPAPSIDLVFPIHIR